VDPILFSKFEKQFRAAACFCHVDLLADAFNSHAVCVSVLCGMKLYVCFVFRVLYLFGVTTGPNNK
jgi:hypothetical protein